MQKLANSPQGQSRRLLIIDDAPSIHDDFRKILAPAQGSPSKLDALEATLLGESASSPERPTFEIDSAFQGKEGLEMVRKGRQENRPYLLAFVDMRMSPGWDGIETAARIWAEDPDMLVVICTAYADYSWDQIKNELGDTGRWFMLRKPLDPEEIRQLARSLTDKSLLLRQRRESSGGQR